MFVPKSTYICRCGFRASNVNTMLRHVRVKREVEPRKHGFTRRVKCPICRVMFNTAPDSKQELCGKRSCALVEKERTHHVTLCW